MSAATPSAARIFTVAGPLFDQAEAPRDGAIATEAALSGSLAVAPDGSVLVADGDVWRIGLDGRVTRIAGHGRRGFAGDGGPATAANVDAQEVAATAEGAVLIVDASHHRIRRVGPDGMISTVAGSGPAEDNKPGAFAGDGGPATQARLNFPSDVTSTTEGGFLIAEEIGDRIRRVAPDGTITTVAGAGTDPGRPRGLSVTVAQLRRRCYLAQWEWPRCPTAGLSSPTVATPGCVVLPPTALSARSRALGRAAGSPPPRRDSSRGRLRSVPAGTSCSQMTTGTGSGA